MGHIRPTESIFDANDPMIKQDIIRIIIQYLQDEGYTVSQMTVSDEAGLRWTERRERETDVRRLKKAIIGMKSF